MIFTYDVISFWILINTSRAHPSIILINQAPLLVEDQACIVLHYDKTDEEF